MVIREPKIDKAVFAEIYNLSVRLQVPVETFLNTVLRECLPFYKLKLNNLELVKITAPDLTDVLTLKRTQKRFANTFVCPTCDLNFDVTKGMVLTVPIRNGRILKMLVCHRCGEQNQKTDTG